MKRLLRTSLVLLLSLAFLAGSYFQPQQVTQAAPPPPDGPAAPGEASPEQAARDRLQAEVLKALADQQPFQSLGDYGWEVQNIIFSTSYTQAVIWLGPVNQATGEAVGAEPLLAVAHYSNPQGVLQAAGEWGITFQTDPDWQKIIQDLPQDLLQQSSMTDNVQMMSNTPQAVNGPTYGGYYLPWAGGLTKYLSWGAYHPSCQAECYHAFDFFDGTMFQIMAAKPGTVYYWRDTCANNDHSCTNSITLMDSSTSPTTYQIYLHLAQGSIPAELKHFGALVTQGQHIATADNTGYSSGTHVHFMVVAQNTLYLANQGYMWGTSVDITFRDVSINWDANTQGGRPCSATDVSYGYCVGKQYSETYTSGNRTANPPTGDLILPANTDVLTQPDVLVGGYASDDRGVTHYQVIANDGGGWKTIGPDLKTSPFATNINFCNAGLHDGPVSLALRIWDVEGNQSVGLPGLRQVSLQAGCLNVPVPAACSPGPNQVSIYGSPDYQGDCKLMDVGKFDNTALGSLSQNVESIQVGANAMATLYAQGNYTGRGETFTHSDPDLSDNLTGGNVASSVWVALRPKGPDKPWLVSPVSTSLSADQSVDLVWENRGGFSGDTATGGWAGTYSVELDGPLGFTPRTRSGFSDLSWAQGSLPPGNYTWKVKAANAFGESDWSTASFTVAPGSISWGSPVSAPQTFTVESGAEGWTAAGLWNRSSSHVHTGSYAWWFGQNISGVDHYSGAGDLTSPPIAIPAGGYYLHFYYEYETESFSPFFDQRWVQISTDGSPFVDVLQLYHDVPASQPDYHDWMSSPWIDLSAYAGHSVQVRFHFDTLDAVHNTGLGWAVDDITLTNTGYVAPTCSDGNEPNDNPSQATPINIGDTVSGQICPNGDWDYYRFSAQAGQPVGVDIDAKTLNPPSALDSQIFLLGPDGSTVLASNDDEVYGKLTDSRLEYTIPADGVYFIKVKAWNHPDVGGTNYNYQLHLLTGSAKPVVNLIAPLQGGYIGNPFDIIVSAMDSSAPIVKVEFYYHDKNWESGSWKLLSTDSNGDDGWTYHYDPTATPETACPDNGLCPAFYVKAYDAAGNWSGAGAWNIGIDHTPPVTSLNALSASQNSTAVWLSWNASDALSGLAAFDFQVSSDGGSTWQAFPQEVDGSLRETWYVGTPGQTLNFRMRGIDNAGNAEAFPASETSVQLAASCSGDSFESDGTLLTARPIQYGANPQSHNLCQGDEDWVTLTPEAGKRYLWMAWPDESGLPRGGGVAVILSLYNSSGGLIASRTPIMPGTPTVLQWIASPADALGPVYLRVRTYDARIFGSDVRYRLWVGEGGVVYIPDVAH